MRRSAVADRNRLQELVQSDRDRRKAGEVPLEGMEAVEIDQEEFDAALQEDLEEPSSSGPTMELSQLLRLKRELYEIRDLLSPSH